MKGKFRRLLERIRGERMSRWPFSRKRDTDRAKGISHDDTGWTVHRDVALRLKNLSLEKAEDVWAAPDPGTEVGAFKIRVAGPAQARREADSIVAKRYASRGYRTSATLLNANISTFAAYDEGRLAGTVSLRLDSPEEGLAADDLYREEIDALRGAGHQVCEFTRLAVDASRVSKPVLAGLFHTVYLFAQKLRGYNYVVIEVNPRHVGYYKRSLGFNVIGSERHKASVDAPAVLMGVSFRAIADNLRRHAGKGKRATAARSFYVHGFSPAEEAGILGRLKNIDERRR